MDQKIIEKYERRRWNIRLVLTIIVAIYGIVLTPVFYDRDFYGLHDGILSAVTILLIAILAISFFIHNRCKHKIKSDPRRNEALNSEMYRYNELRAFKATAIGLIFTFMVIELVSGHVGGLPGKLLFFILFIVWILIFFVAWLIYNK